LQRLLQSIISSPGYFRHVVAMTDPEVPEGACPPPRRLSERSRSILREAVARQELERTIFLLSVLEDEAIAVREEVSREITGRGGDPSVLQTGGALASPVWERVAAALAEEDEEPQPSLVRERIGSVRIETVLGSGGMGTVWRGFDEKLERSVAVKMLPGLHRMRAEARGRFLREARLLSKLNHPGICQVYDLIEGDETDYLVLELVEGRTLGRYLEEEALDLDRRLEIGERIAEALAVAHRRRIVHRDLKPDNVMISAEGSVKVLDFGIAKSSGVGEEAVGAPDRCPIGSTDETVAAGQAGSDEFHTRQGARIGTLRYMSPEQAAGKPVTEASDVYALGLVMRELVTGEQAIEEGPLPLVLARVERGELRALPKTLDPALACLLAELASLDPERRPAAAEVAARIRWLRAAPARRRRRWTLGMAVAAVLLAVVAAAWFSRQLALGGALLEPGQEGRVVLLPVANRTGEASLSWVELGLAELVARSLAGLDGIEILPVEEGARWLAGRGEQAGEPAAQELAALARSRGAALVIRPVLEAEGEGLKLTYRTANAAGRSSERAVRAREPTALASELARHLAPRLAPDAATPGLALALAEDPFVNRLYAMGVQVLQQQGGEPARPYFSICLRQEPDFAWARLRLAQVDLLAGRDDEVREAMSSLSGLGPHQRVEMGMTKGRLAGRLGDWEAAEMAFEEARGVAQEHGLAEAEGRLLRAWAEAEIRQGRREEGLRRVEAAREIFEASGDAASLLDLALVEALALIEGSAPEAAIAKLETVVAEAERQGDPWALQLARMNIAGQQIRLRRFAEAESVLDEALEFLQGAGDRDSALLVLNNLGAIYQSTGRPAQATDAYARVRELATAAGRVEPRALAALNEATIRVAQGRVAEARALLEEAASLESWVRDSPYMEAGRLRLNYEEGDYAGAWEDFRTFRAAHPELEAQLAPFAAPMEKAAATGVRAPLPDDLDRDTRGGRVQ
jgi:tetratricopeptide (TPR) repeat protein